MHIVSMALVSVFVILSAILLPAILRMSGYDVPALFELNNADIRNLSVVEIWLGLGVALWMSRMAVTAWCPLDRMFFLGFAILAFGSATFALWALLSLSGKEISELPLILLLGKAACIAGVATLGQALVSANVRNSR